MYRSFLAGLASKGPLLLAQDVYLIGTAVYDEPIQIGPATFGLVRAGSLEALATLHDRIYAKEVFELKQEFIKARTSHSHQTAKQRTAELGLRTLVAFVINELMPHMSGDDGVGELLGERPSTETPPNVNVAQLKDGLRQEHFEKGQAEYGVQDEEACLARFVERPALIMDKVVYELTKHPTGDIIMRRERYAVSSSKPFDDVEAKLRRFCMWKVELAAIDELVDFLSSQQKTQLARSLDIDVIMHQHEYNNGHVGFINKTKNDPDILRSLGLDYGRGFFVYHIIPPFAMLDPRPHKQGICYEFPQLRVAVALWVAGSSFEMTEPVLVDPVPHPFAPYGHGFEPLCGGQVPFLGHYKTRAEWVAKALSDGKNLVTSGFTPESIMQHSTSDGLHYGMHPADVILQPRQITVQEALNRGLELTNKWDWTRAGSPRRRGW